MLPCRSILRRARTAPNINPIVKAFRPSRTPSHAVNKAAIFTSPAPIIPLRYMGNPNITTVIRRITKPAANKLRSAILPSPQVSAPLIPAINANPRYRLEILYSLISPAAAAAIKSQYKNLHTKYRLYSSFQKKRRILP